MRRRLSPTEPIAQSTSPTLPNHASQFISQRDMLGQHVPSSRLPARHRADNPGLTSPEPVFNRPTSAQWYSEGWEGTVDSQRGFPLSMDTVPHPPFMSALPRALRRGQGGGWALRGVPGGWKKAGWRVPSGRMRMHLRSSLQAAPSLQYFVS